jgi:hypothetical protein
LERNRDLNPVRSAIYFQTFEEMLIPSKYENLQQNLLVIGSDVIAILKSRPYDIESLYQELKSRRPINLDQFYNCLTFLWLSEVVSYQGFQVSLKEKE